MIPGSSCFQMLIMPMLRPVMLRGEPTAANRDQLQLILDVFQKHELRTRICYDFAGMKAKDLCPYCCACRDSSRLSEILKSDMMFEYYPDNVSQISSDMSIKSCPW